VSTRTRETKDGLQNLGKFAFYVELMPIKLKFGMHATCNSPFIRVGYRAPLYQNHPVVLISNSIISQAYTTNNLHYYNTSLCYYLMATYLSQTIHKSVSTQGSKLQKKIGKTNTTEK
jgi:hypothetical protein